MDKTEINSTLAAKKMDINELEIGDLVIWENPSEDFRRLECRVKNIHYRTDHITSDTEVTIMDFQDNAYDVYACELDYI